LKKKLFCILFALVLLLTLTLVPAIPAVANTVSSSTIVFQASSEYPLTHSGGIYSGVVPCAVDGGYDIYGKEGATAWFGNDPGGGAVWTTETISSNDAWPTWTPDTPDWYQYSLYLYEDAGVQKWAIRNHPGATETNPWYDDTHWGSDKAPMGVPMSGTMDWNTMYAMETDVGAYLPATGTPEIPGGAAGKGGGAGAWDMDWSWGSEVVPLQFPGFDVVVGGSSPNYTVTLTPAAAGATNLTVDVPDILAISVDPTSIDYGSLIPGATSDTQDIDVTNVGTVTADVGASVSGSALFVDNLEIKNYTQAGSYSMGPWALLIDDLVMDDSETLRTRITVPGSYTPSGVETAVLTFSASSS